MSAMAEHSSFFSWWKSVGLPLLTVRLPRRISRIVRMLACLLACLFIVALLLVFVAPLVYWLIGICGVIMGLFSRVEMKGILVYADRDNCN